MITAAQSGEEQTAPTIGKPKLHFNRVLHFFRSAQSRKHTLAGGSGGITLARRRSTLEERGDLAQLFAKFLFSGHSTRPSACLNKCSVSQHKRELGKGLWETRQ